MRRDVPDRSCGAIGRVFLFGQLPQVSMCPKTWEPHEIESSHRQGQLKSGFKKKI